MSLDFRPLREFAPRAPRFQEAYPRLDFVEAQKAIGQGRKVCVFTRRYSGNRAGHFNFDQYLYGGGVPLRMDGWLQIVPAPDILHCDKGVSFEISPRAIGVKHLRYYSVGRVCQREKSVLVYIRSWACRSCHGLVFLSQLQPDNYRRAQAVRNLREEVRRGRPKHAHSAKFRTKEQRLHELEAASTEAIHMPSDEHRRIVDSRWVSFAEDREWQGGPPERL